MSEHKYVAMPTFTDGGICLNHQKVGNLKKYLDRFPDDAEVVISGTDSEGNYHHFDCCIGCNFDFQTEHKRVVLSLGTIQDLPITNS